MLLFFPFACTIFAPPAAPVRVDPGVYTLDGREVWLGGFTLAAAPGPEESCPDALPTVDERRVAARSPTFSPSAMFEALKGPPEDACTTSMAVVEAEGVDGWSWFGGAGKQLGEGEVMSSAGDPRDQTIRVGTVAMAFFGEDSKPNPRGARCVTRDPVATTQAWVLASSVNVRYGRGTNFAVVEKVAAGAAVTVWWRDGEWAWIEAPRSVVDTSGTERTVHRCTVFGWVKNEFLSDVPGDPSVYVREAEAAIADGRLTDGVVPLERAAALLPHAVALREALADIYAATGHASAGAVARQATAMRKKAPRVAWSPEANTVSFATLCLEDPAVSTWTIGPDGDGCLLPWSAGGATEWAPDLKGWIDLDPRDLKTACGGEPPPRHQTLAVAPTDLSIQVPPGSARRAAIVRRRVVQGIETDAAFRFTGFGPWQTMALRGDIGEEGAILAVPVSDVMAGATHAVVLEVEVFELDAARSATTVIQVVWPLKC